MGRVDVSPGPDPRAVRFELSSDETPVREGAGETQRATPMRFREARMWPSSGTRPDTPPPSPECKLWRLENLV